MAHSTVDQANTAGVRAWSNPLLAVATFAVIFCFHLYFVLRVALDRLVFGDNARHSQRVACWMHTLGRWCAWVMRRRVTVRGNVPPPGCLLAPNHIGYADIIAMSAAVPCFFVAKADVAGWPVVGWFARHLGYVFANRRRTREMVRAGDDLKACLARGCSVCLFAEGTSSGGDRVLPFRSSFLQPAVDTGVLIVPVGIRWRATRPGICLTEDVAYWKDHAFVPHFFRYLGLHGIEAQVTFGEPISALGGDRKVLAEAVRARVLELAGIAESAESAGRETVYGGGNGLFRSH